MNRPASTLDGKLFAIGVLSITACILFVGFLMVTLNPRPALAHGQLDRGGDFIMLTQQISSSVEGVVLIDSAANRLLLYAFDFNNKRLEILDGLDLAKMQAREQRPRR